MYQFSDSDSIDSDEGIRYKTDSIRNKNKSSGTDSPGSKRERSRSRKKRSRSKSPRYHSQSGRRKSRKHKREPSKERRNSSTSKARSDDRSLRKEKARSRRDVPKEKEKSIQISDKARKHTKSPTLERKSTDTTKRAENTNISAGPQLPPCLLNASPTDENAQNEAIGPSLPPNFITVSSLDEDSSNDTTETPATTQETTQTNIVDTPSEDLSVIGPALPPHLLIKKDDAPASAPLPSEPTDKIIGPAIPSRLRQKLAEESASVPTKPDEASDDEVYGPVPVGDKFTKAHIELEERALQIKLDQLEPTDDKAEREEWMLSLPQAKAASFGLGPRQFRAKAGPDLSDRSSWTDTPEDKAKKKTGKVEPKIDLQREAEVQAIQRRDKEQEAIAKKSKRHKESLLDIHTKKLKKEKKSDDGPAERRPFSRDIDLQVNRFDEAQKKAVLKKAQLLDSRFSAGESKFL